MIIIKCNDVNFIIFTKFENTTFQVLYMHPCKKKIRDQKSTILWKNHGKITGEKVDFATIANSSGIKIQI
jgi:hypothetical protein